MIEVPKELLLLESVGACIEIPTKIVYPLTETRHVDFEAGVHIDDCTDEWFQALSTEDSGSLVTNGII